ncbi:MAG: replication initiation protein, partial [Phenylobacterium sp.]|nr:replication initiation protein [Phenylobacterium sp.]
SPPRKLAAPAATAASPSSVFPEGSIRWSKEFAQIAQAHGGGWDIDLIAGSYREQMGERLAKLSGAKLMKSWTGFCQAFAARRGRP